MFTLGEYITLVTYQEGKCLETLSKEKSIDSEEIARTIKIYNEQSPENKEKIKAQLDRYDYIFLSMSKDLDEGMSELGDALHKISLVLHPEYWNQELEG